MAAPPDITALTLVPSTRQCRPLHLSSHGVQVETVWNALRVFCVALGLVSQYVPAAICATVVLLMACGLVNLHLEILPFHSPVENMVRGGIYACVAWTALARHVQRQQR
jgi:hypothetical protein